MAIWDYSWDHSGKRIEDKVDELVIQFDSNEVSYKRSEWNKIKLSYCCSIHKSQELNSKWYSCRW